MPGKCGLVQLPRVKTLHQGPAFARISVHLTKQLEFICIPAPDYAFLQFINEPACFDGYARLEYPSMPAEAVEESQSLPSVFAPGMRHLRIYTVDTEVLL